VNKFINLTFKIPSSNVTIGEKYSTMDEALNRGAQLQKAHGGHWTITFGNK
jgi:hypothetical protein